MPIISGKWQIYGGCSIRAELDEPMNCTYFNGTKWSIVSRVYTKYLTQLAGHIYITYLTVDNSDLMIGRYSEGLDGSGPTYKPSSHTEYYVQEGTLDFGETEQTISDTLYSLLTKWASPHSKTINGTFTLKPYIQWPNIEHTCYDFFNFTNGGQNYEAFGMYSDSIQGKKVDDDAFYMIAHDQGGNGYITWHTGNAKDRTFEIVGEHKVSKRFYDWLMVNCAEKGKNCDPITVDMTDFSLRQGNHIISVNARASGYKDSDESNAVSYEVSFISFGIDHMGVVQHNTAKEGMTWGEWVESKYNTDIYRNAGDRITYNGHLLFYDSLYSEPVKPNDTIRRSHVYCLKYDSSGSND